MEEITIFDGIVAFVMLFSGILAYSRGLLRETLAIAGWIVAAIGAFFIAPLATPLVYEIPFLSDIIGSSCELSIISAFIVTFILVLIVVSVLVPILSGTVRNSALGGIDQMLGLMFGILRGLVLVLVVLIVHDRLVPKGDGIGMIEDSLTKQLLSTSQSGIETQIPNNAPKWIIDRFDELMASCRPPDQTSTPGSDTETDNGQSAGDNSQATESTSGDGDGNVDSEQGAEE